MSERDLSVTLQGNLERNAVDALGDGPLPGLPSGHIEANATVVYARDDDPTTFRANVLLTDLDAEAHVEDFIGVFSEPAAVQVETLRQVHEPLGRMNTNILIESGLDSAVETVIRVDNVHDTELNLLDGRVAIADLSGEVTVKLGLDDVFMFRNLRGEVSFQGMAVGVVEFNGDAPLGLFLGEEFGEARELPFEILIENGRFESPLTRRIVELFMSSGTNAWYDQAQPSGMYNAIIQITKEGTSGTLSPRSFAYDNDGKRAEYKRVAGEIEFHPGGGMLRDMRLHGDGWTLTTEGRWKSPSEGVISLDATFSVEAEELTESLRASLPLALREGMDALSLSVTGPIRIDQGHLQYTIRPNFENPFVEVAASGTFERAHFLASVEVDECTGAFSLVASIDPGETYAAFSFDLSVNQMLASGITMRNAEAHVTRDADGFLELTSFSGDCHGGTVAAQARVWPSEGGASEYFANLQLASVRLSPVLLDLENHEQASAEADATASPGVLRAGIGTNSDEVLDNTRGMLEGNLSIGGMVGDPASRRGTGRFRVAGGEVVKSPALVMLIEFTSLQFPAGAMLDYATLDFFIDGETVAIEDVSIYSSRIKIWGFGTLNWPTQKLDMRFFAKSAYEIPILSKLFNVWHKLVSVEVTGKVGEQRIVPKIFEFSGNPFRGVIRLGGRNPGEMDDKSAMMNVIGQGEGAK